jgi:hypothetical protein
MPKRATSPRLVDTATKCRATAASPSAPTSQARAEAAFCMVSWVVKVLLAMTNRVVRGCSVASTVARSARVEVGDVMHAQLGVAKSHQRLGGHARAEVGAADADVDDVADRFAGGAAPVAAVDSGDEALHLRQFVMAPPASRPGRHA